MQLTKPCREWSGSRHPRGYGRRWDPVAKKVRLAHRMAYEESVGPIPDGLDVLHHCDNPPCTEPEHLYAGTPTDNARDREDRGRHKAATGESNGRSKVSDADVQVIRRLRDDGRTLAALGRQFGISTSQVHRITRQEQRV